MSQRILVVDDDRQIVRLLETYLKDAGFRVLTAYNGEDALRTAQRERPNLIVLDIQLPERDGWEITRRVRADEQRDKLVATPILMLTARVEDTDKIVGLELGADDYLTKPFNPREVVARVRAILRRTQQPALPPRILEFGALRLDVAEHRLIRDGQPVELTPTEFALLKTFMENPRHAFTRAELIERAMGYAYEGLDRTLDSHIKNLRKKIEPDPRAPRYIETVFGVGYRFNPPPSAADAQDEQSSAQPHANSHARRASPESDA